MPFDVKALLHNKPALIGLGVAGAAGLYVLIKRKQTTGSTASDAASGAGATTVGTVSGYPDTTQTDFANWLGNYSANLQSQQDQFQQQVQSSIDQIKNTPTSPPVSSSPSGYWIPAPGPVAGAVYRPAQNVPSSGFHFS